MAVAGAQVLIGSFAEVLAVAPKVVIMVASWLHVDVVGVGIVRV